MEEKLKKLEELIGYRFKNIDILKQAFIHSSYTNEHHIERYEDNQRLEFLGDAVLELIVSDYLYKNFPDKEEGFLTKKRARLVCEETLSKIAINLNLYDYLLLGNGENIEKVKNNSSIMCDTYESFIGAIYIDAGLNECELIIKKYLLTDDNLNLDINNYKSILQEFLNVKKQVIKYEVSNETGPDHNKEFYINAIVDGKLVGSGMGKSKKEAEQNAAKAAIYKLMV